MYEPQASAGEQSIGDATAHKLLLPVSVAKVFWQVMQIMQVSQSVHAAQHAQAAQSTYKRVGFQVDWH